MKFRLVKHAAGALIALALSSLSGLAHARPGAAEQPGRYLAVASDKTIGDYLERISWTNNYSYDWTAPKGYDFVILDAGKLNRFGELASAKSYAEAVENLLNSIHKKHLSNLGIAPVALADDGEPEGATLQASIYRGNSTLIVGAWDTDGSTVPALPGAAERQ